MSRYSNERLPKLLDRVRGKGLCVSLLLDSTTQVWNGIGDKEESLPPSLPSLDQLKKTVEEFKKSLVVTQEKSREIERITHDQRNSSVWFDVRRY